MADNLAYKDTVAVIKDFRDFINNVLSGVSGSPVVDPLDDSGKTRGTDTGLAVYGDDSKIANYPKITFNTIDLSRDRMGGGKTAYTERHRHEFAIIYTCHKQHTWTYNDIAYKGKQQCIKYLQYLGDQIKAYADDFGMNEIVLGSVSNPVPNPDTHTISASILIKCDSYGKIGD